MFKGKKRKRQIELAENIRQVNEQLAKLTRLQFKSGQDIQTGLDRLSQELGQAINHQIEQEQNTILSQQNEHLINVLLMLLDDFDTAASGLAPEENNAWLELVRQWSARIINSLSIIDIYEVNLLGKSFIPQLAEGLGTKPRPMGILSNIPYEVAAVIRRGFIYSDGRLLRKAQVITYEEANTND